MCKLLSGIIVNKELIRSVGNILEGVGSLADPSSVVSELDGYHGEGIDILLCCNIL